MSLKSIICAILVASACAGCMRVITIRKHDPIPVCTNGTAYVDGGYTFNYRNIGLKTDVSSISAEKTADGVTIKIKGFATDISPESKETIGATGTAVGNIAEKVIEGVSGR